jgi:hypothetical protein
VHDGQHPAIIDQATWDGVQAQLASNTSARTSRRLASAHLLIGRIRDEAGRAISPTHAQKGSTRYRYYVAQPSRSGSSSAISRIPAAEIEAEVVRALRSSVQPPHNPSPMPT